PDFASSLSAFDITDEQRRAVRSVISIEVTRVADSCGFVVPQMSYERERDQLYRYADNRLRKEGPDAVKAYVSANNAESIDGLTGLDSLVDGAEPVTAGRKLSPTRPAQTQLCAPAPPAHSVAARRSCSALDAWYAAGVEP